MIRLAARYADQWDTFPALPGTATDGVTETIEDRLRRFDAAVVEAGRDPASIRRSTWAEAPVARDADAYSDFVRQHAAIGFTDFATVHPGTAHVSTLRRIAGDVIPRLRESLQR